MEQTLRRQLADRQTLARPFPVGGDDPTHESKHVVSFDAAADASHQNRMPDAREVGPDVHLGIPRKATDVLMHSRRRGQRPLAGTAGVRVVDIAPYREPDRSGSSARVMKHTLAKTGSEDRARFRVVDLESMTLTDSHRLIQNLGAECGDPGFEIIEEFANLGSMALPRAARKAASARLSRCATSPRSMRTRFSGVPLDRVARQRLGLAGLQDLQKGRPVLLDLAAPTPGISSSTFSEAARCWTIAASCSFVNNV